MPPLVSSFCPDTLKVEGDLLHQLVMGAHITSSTNSINDTINHINGSHTGGKGGAGLGTDAGGRVWRTGGAGGAAPHECSIVLRPGTAVVPDAIAAVHLVQGKGQPEIIS